MTPNIALYLVSQHSICRGDTQVINTTYHSIIQTYTYIFIRCLYDARSDGVAKPVRLDKILIVADPPPLRVSSLNPAVPRHNDNRPQARPPSDGRWLHITIYDHCEHIKNTSLVCILLTLRRIASPETIIRPLL